MSERVTDYPGEEVTAEELRGGRWTITRHMTELRYSWSSGQAISRFLEGLREGELWGRRCRNCLRTLVPPRMYCELCFRRTDEWVRLRDTGRVATYSVSYVNADSSRRDTPIYVAVIEIDGASPLMGILHLLGEIDSPAEVAVGMRVSAVWKPRSEREGAVTDIRYFKRARGATGYR